MFTYKQRKSLIQKRLHKKNLKNINSLLDNKTLVNMDYLIMNLKGNPFGHFNEDSQFKAEFHSYGTSVFVNRSDIYYKNIKLGVLLSVPKSDIISKNLSQFQLENNLFYTFHKPHLKSVLEKFCNETELHFDSINRLDICLDRQDNKKNYASLFNNIINSKYLVSGRTKNLASYFDSEKGKYSLNGFTLGKRTSEKLVRVYNKTLNLTVVEKPYINEYYQNNGIENTNIWRLEYQLNSKFFSNKKEFSKATNTIALATASQKITWQIFDLSFLVQLVKIANKGFFEIRENTGKSQVNKEKLIPYFDFEKLEFLFCKYVPIVAKFKKPRLVTSTIKKRLAKSLFREYYQNNQKTKFLIPLKEILNEFDYQNNRGLLEWFNSKVTFYLHEFQNKENIKVNFDKKLFELHKTAFI